MLPVVATNTCHVLENTLLINATGASSVKIDELSELKYIFAPIECIVELSEMAYVCLVGHEE